MLSESSLSNHVNAAGLLLPLLACFHQKRVVKRASSSSSLHRQRTPSTRCLTCPFNTSSLRASSSSMRCSMRPSTCRQHTLFNALSLRRALPCVVYAPFTMMLLPPSTHCCCALFGTLLCASLQHVFARAIQLIVVAPFHVMLTCPSTALLWNRLIVACIHS